jgi:hypothetical protein
LPSFVAPIRADLRRASAVLAAWWCLLRVAGIGALSGTLAASLAADGVAPAASAAVLALAGIAAVLLTLAAAARWRHHRRHGTGAHFVMHPDGRLAGVMDGGRPVRAQVTAIDLCGPFVTLRLRRVAPPHAPPPPRRWVLACDGLERDTLRRLSAWARSGLPQNFPAPSGSIPRDEGNSE